MLQRKQREAASCGGAPTLSRPLSSNASLPPKKRLRLVSDASRLTTASVVSASGGGSANSEWTTGGASAMKCHQDGVRKMLQLCGATVAVPERRAKIEGRKTGEKKSTKKSFKSTASSKGDPSSATVVKDVNGRDIGMGYFSTMS